MVLATIAFTLQVYGDFSGYSDIAIGSGRLFGIDLMTNFQTPYFSTSLREVWQRWHISLSTWLRDYLYVPLGGSRVSERRWRFNILATFTISGLWHGAAWPYVVWGAMHGAALVVEEYFRRHTRFAGRLPAWLCWLATFSFFNFALLVFRSPTMTDLATLLSRLGTIEQGSLTRALVSTYGSVRGAGYVLASVALFAALELRIGKADINRVFRDWPRPLRWAGYYALILWILLIGDLDSAPVFIYFQF